MLRACWLNGQPTDGLPVQERGFAYGDGLFSTVAVRAGQAVLIDLHWQRLVRGCERLGIPVDALPTWQADFQRFVTLHPEGILKIMVTRGEGGRGYLPEPTTAPNCYVFAYTPASHPLTHQQGMDTAFLNGRLGLNPLLAGLKHLNRLEQVLLRRELAQTGHAEALVCDLAGRLVEGVFSNVFLVRDGQLQTPVLDQAGVDGVMRRHLLDMAPMLGIPVAERVLWPDDVHQADGIFFCNSLYGIWPVRRLAERLLPSCPVTRQLQQRLHHV